MRLNLPFEQKKSPLTMHYKFSIEREWVQANCAKMLDGISSDWLMVAFGFHPPIKTTLIFHKTISETVAPKV